MTTIVERKSDRDVIFGFVTVMFALAAWRGWAGARTVAVVFAVLAAVAAIAWIWMRRQPLTEIVVTPSEITWGQRGAVSTRIERGATTVLAFRSAGNHRHRTWWLYRFDAPDAPGISMSGFRPQEVGPACRLHGWVFAERSLF